LLHDRDAAIAVVQNCQAVTGRWYEPVADIPASFADISAYVKPGLSKRIAPNFQQTCDELCYPGAVKPSWSDVCDRVESDRELLTLS
jgi:hypothetical protein